jgi:hypothetical protein
MIGGGKYSLPLAPHYVRSLFTSSLFIKEHRMSAIANHRHITPRNDLVYKRSAGDQVMHSSQLFL